MKEKRGSRRGPDWGGSTFCTDPGKDRFVRATWWMAVNDTDKLDLLLLVALEATPNTA